MPRRGTVRLALLIIVSVQRVLALLRRVGAQKHCHSSSDVGDTRVKSG